MSKTLHHCVYDLHYHIVLVTKYRRPVLNEKIRDRLVLESRRLLEGYDAELIECETDQDHIHYLVAIPPKYSVSTVVNVLKGVTARIIRRDYWDDIKDCLWGKSLWSDSYYVGTAGGATLETIKQYIEKQGQPKRKYVMKKRVPARPRQEE